VSVSRLKRLLVLAILLLGMWGLKVHYVEARPDDLGWMLGPTTKLVSALTGARFELEPGAGYLSRERLFLIEKPCAGINFMIAALGMIGFVLARRVASFVSGACVIGASLALGYLGALLANAARISLALWLASHPLGLGFVTAAEIHRIEGITVYFGALVLLHAVAVRLRSAPVFARGAA
jgi:exosortase K